MTQNEQHRRLRPTDIPDMLKTAHAPGVQPCWARFSGNVWSDCRGPEWRRAAVLLAECSARICDDPEVSRDSAACTPGAASSSTWQKTALHLEARWNKNHWAERYGYQWGEHQEPAASPPESGQASNLEPHRQVEARSQADCTGEVHSAAVQVPERRGRQAQIGAHADQPEQTQD